MYFAIIMFIGSYGAQSTPNLIEHVPEVRHTSHYNFV